MALLRPAEKARIYLRRVQEMCEILTEILQSLNLAAELFVGASKYTLLPNGDVPTPILNVHVKHAISFRNYHRLTVPQIYASL